jgi:hypothetical protein
MSDERTLRRNWLRRVGGVAICISPIVIAVSSIVVGTIRGTALTPYGLYVVLLAAVIGVFNFCLSFVRPLLYRLVHGSWEDYHFVSGLPILGDAYRGGRRPA